MTEAESGTVTEIIAGVPVHYRGEYVLSVEDDYERIYEEDRHDSEHLEGLDSEPGTTTALYAVASARYLADKTGTLGEVLREPYTLRTTRDVEAVLAALGQHIAALAAVAEGLGVWLDAAYQRGELDGEPAAARTELGRAADLLRAAGLPLREVVVPGDRSPALDMDTLIAGVIEQLRARGIEVAKVHVFDSETRWELGGDRHLALSSENSWSLLFPTGKPSRWKPVSFGLYCWYAHPEQVADLVVKTLSEAEA
ncbi:hypothetical protein O7626_03070 [Micromonospora sp. WMMD1102]|uniref:hypothetical protein n=1 Tax=Micromonospora sp. WMMD1102 TaxID=3016105 RepID=UPI0024157EB9|nr:hypothetical protein [Micromonospora sp. WMMD1102]MDG4784922.1 hypothetical protein [Micromonospora sp. WMMD1102]